jgi:hypothetical protein
MLAITPFNVQLVRLFALVDFHPKPYLPDVFAPAKPELPGCVKI